MIKDAARTVAAVVVATAVAAWIVLGRRDIKPANVRRPRTGPPR